MVKSYDTVEGFNGLQPGEDVLWWKGSSRAEFKVNEAYRLMVQGNHQTCRWPWKQFWKCRIPHKSQGIMLHMVAGLRSCSDPGQYDEKRDNLML